jgi:hypothetical protein
MACIDPHLISGADVIVDVNDPMLAELEKVQLSYLRRLLGLGTHAIRAPLFTELGLIPLRYRRLIIALRYLRYLVGLAHDHYAWLALQDSYCLFLDGKQGYWMDLVYALGRLPVPIHLPALTELTSEKCEALGKSVYTAAMKYLDYQVAKSPRLYLLRDRLEPVKDELPRPITACLRHYMTLVVNSRHRKALTRLLLGHHCLAIERLRYEERYFKASPRARRLCRFGCARVETAEHALFFCDGSLDVMERRAAFVVRMRRLVPAVTQISRENATQVLKKLIFDRDTVCKTAKFVHQIFMEFDSIPIWRPPESRK